MTTNFPTPYHEALHWIKANPTSGSSLGMAKLVMSLWNGDVAFSFRECISSFDQEREALALRLVQAFVAYGETAELVRIGHEINEFYPRLWELGTAGSLAQAALRRRWREEAEREADDEG